MSTRRARIAPRRWIRILGITALVLVAAYPVAVNLCLALGGVQKMFESTDTVKVDFRRAWSFWPGRVHVEDIRVTMQDRNVQFALTMPSVEVTVRLRDLVHRKFHATKLRGSDLSFRFRHRIEPETAGAPFVQALPPIPEFPDPPLREAGPPEAPLDEAHYNLWTVQFDDVDVEVSELWAQMFRFQGGARVVGAFRLRPAKRLWVGPAELRFERGSVVTGPHEVASSIEGTLTCKVDDFDVEPVHGMEPFRFISARTALELSISNLDAIRFLAGPSSTFELEDGSGALDLDVALDHGVFTSDSQLAYRTTHVGVSVGPGKFDLDGELGIKGHGPAPGESAAVVLGIPNASLRFDRTRFAPIDLHDVAASLATTTVDVTRPWAFAGATAKFAATLSDLRSLQDAPVPRRSWRIDAGRGDASGSATMSSDDAIDGSLRVHLEHAKGMAAGSTFRASADANATVRGQGFRDLRVEGQLSARELRACLESGICSGAPNVHVSGELVTKASQDFRGRFSLEADHIDADFGATRVSARTLSSRGEVSPAGIAANVELERVSAGAIGTCPFIQTRAATLQGELRTSSSGSKEGHWRGALQDISFEWGRFHLGAAQTGFSSSWAEEQLSARLDSADLRLLSSGGAPNGWQANLGSALVRANLRTSDAGVSGPVRIEVSGLKGVVGKTNVQGDVVASLDVRTNDETYRTADVSGVIQAKQVVLGAGKRQVSDWWAELALHRVHLDVRQNFDFAGSMGARFRDALPALYVLASEDQVPKWTPNVLPLRSLKLELEVERFCHWTDVQLAEASGGPLKAAGRLQIEPGETRGAILLQLTAFEPVSMGLDFVEDYSSTSLLAGHDWLEKHLEPLTKAATDKHDDRCKPEPTTCE